MANEIKIPSFLNYTDTRKKNALPEIEVESIKNYASSIGAEGLKVFLSQIPDEILVAEIHLRMMDRQSKIDGVARHIGL